MLLDEIAQLKREKELLDRSLANKDAEILDIHQQFEVTSSAARTADNKIRLLESQVDYSVMKMNMMMIVVVVVMMMRVCHMVFKFADKTQPDDPCHWRL